MARDLYETVTNKIIEALEKGTAPWVQGHSRKHHWQIPCNAVTNRPYSGVNLFLYFCSAAAGYDKPRFLTFKQAKAAGGHVKKGEKGMALYFFKPVETKEIDKATGKPKKFFLLREYTVFNVAQCENLPRKIVEGDEPSFPANADTRNALADKFIKESGANLVEGGGFPSYNKVRDVVKLPRWDEFHNGTHFYATAFHELVHWTGHKSRLDRLSKGGIFGTPEYAAEELVAELGAVFLCAEFGFEVVDNSAAYIKSWVKLLSDNKRAIFTAASAAQKAVDFLHHRIEPVKADSEEAAA